MVSTTEQLRKTSVLEVVLRSAASAALIAALLLSGGCGTKAKPAEQPDTRKGYGMGGVEQDIAVLQSTIDAKPASPDLSTPEAAVRSYLDWASYAYRIGESDVATQTMTPNQLVKVDAFNQYNLQEKQLIDQTLESIKFGKTKVRNSSATLPATEKWTYRYVSISVAGKTLRGPYKATYKTTYTLVKEKKDWRVDSISVVPVGEVK